MADPIAELNMVFEMCGVADPATRTNIINREGFTSLEDLGVLETDTDVSDMAKRLASRTQPRGEFTSEQLLSRDFRHLFGGFETTRNADLP
jgi:hypothetical protein